MDEVPIIWMGYDGAEHDAYLVARASIIDKASGPVVIKPLHQATLRHIGFYRRSYSVIDRQMHDDFDAKPFSTQFTFTRFLVPMLMARHGWAIFMDCDMLIRDDIYKLWDLRDEKYALQCVKHDHAPDAEFKMFGQVQTKYSRKNWSSVMLINCGHFLHKKLSIDDVNTSSGHDLHNFKWCNGSAEKYIGELHERWNWLENHSDDHIYPAIVHLTEGGPWIPNFRKVAFEDEWRVYFDQIDETNRERI